MADYYYASVRNYITTGNATKDTCTLSNTKPSNPLATKTTCLVWYVVDVYHVTNSAYDTFDKWVAGYNPSTGEFPGTLQSNPNGTNVEAHVNLNTTSDYIRLDGTFFGATKTSEQSLPKSGPANDYYHSHIYFNISHQKGKEGGTVQCIPSLRLTRYIEGSATLTTGVDIPGIYYVSTKGTTNPTVAFSANKQGPTFPEKNILDWLSANNPPTGSLGLTISGSQWVDCKNAWYVNITYVTDKFGTVSTVWTFDVNGLHLIGTKPGNPALTAKEIKKWNATNLNIFNSAKLGTICSGSSADSGTAVGSVPTPPSSDERYNPPPHIFARSISYGERMRTYQDASGKPLSAAAVKALAAEIPAPKDRGRIIQDPNGASALNKNFDTITFPGTSSDLWGFRFMYNPTTFSYSTSSNNSVDWTLGSSDPATLLAGNQTVNFDLYLNRIPDMSYLKDLELDPSSVPSLTSAYGRALNPDTEIPGIRNRGTEYDIEFLYRVVNGDPLKNPLLFDKNYNGYTADFGYTTATPCWLYLNNNMRYFGSVASIQVNHVMFDLNMVPMLSVVSIAFSRYPALWNDNNVPNAKYVNNSKNIMTAITGSTTRTTTTPGG
jgi:hypothetical protein